MVLALIVVVACPRVTIATKRTSRASLIRKLWPIRDKKKKTVIPSPLESGLETLTNQITKVTPNSKQPQERRGGNGVVTHVIQNLLAALASSIALIPEASVFAMTAGLNPLVGLGSTIVLGSCSGALGGRPGLVSGASATVAMILQPLCAEHGHVALSVASVLAGLIQIGLAATRCSQYIRVVPKPVMLGFVNGLAVKVVKAQIPHFQHPHGVWLKGKPLQWHVIWVFASAIIIEFLPKITSSLLPSSLVALGLATVVANVYHLPIPRLSDMVGHEAFQGGFETLFKALFPFAGPRSLFPPFGSVLGNMETLRAVLPIAVEMAVVGLLQSLLTLQIIDNKTHTRGKNTRESLAQGMGNVLASSMGGMGGSALLGQSLVNVNAGGTSRLSSIAVSVFCLLGVTFFAPILGNIPVAALVGLMFTVAHHTFSWDLMEDVFKRQVPVTDLIIIAMVSWTTAFVNMAAAVGLGVLASALRFAWQASCNMSATHSGPLQQRTVRLKGPLFFGSTMIFQRLCEPTSKDREWAEKIRVRSTASSPAFRKPTREVVLDFIDCQVWDQAAIMALEALAQQYHALDIKLRLRHLSPDCREKVLERSDIGDFSAELEKDPQNDPVYLVGADPTPRKQK